ncbi:MAG: hypothetical protein QOF59_2237 [Actinomycetota bacterium]|nr:hypothetical protein [Actinomycetota bacterium]
MGPTLPVVTEYVDPDPDREPDLETVPPAASFPPPYAGPPSAPSEQPAGTEPPPGGRGPVTAFLAAVVVVALIVGFATATLVLDARDTDTSRTSAASGSTSPTTIPFFPTPGPTAPSGPVDRDDGVLAGLIVKQTDVPASATVHHLPHGADLTVGTLDLCNGTFPTEAKRTARRQVSLTDAQGVTHFSTEAILYRGASVGAHAFDELRSVVAHCPSTPVKSPIGEATATTTFRPAPDGAWPRTPTVERLAYDFVSVSTDSPVPSHAMAVYLRRGRVLMGLYFPAPETPQIAVHGRTTIPGIVSVFQDRMAKLPARVVNG